MVDQSDSYPRSTDPLVIILRKTSKILRQGLEIFTPCITVMRYEVKGLRSGGTLAMGSRPIPILPSPPSGVSDSDGL